jgi:hypothetical protein
MISWNCFHSTLNAYKSSFMVYFFKILCCWEWGKVGMKTRNHFQVDHSVYKFGTMFMQKVCMSYNTYNACNVCT